MRRANHQKALIMRRRRTQITLAVGVSSLSLVTIGFSSWVASNLSASGNASFDALVANVVEGGATTASCFSSLSLNTIQYYTDYGLVNASGIYDSVMDFVGTFVLDVPTALSAIETLSVNHQFSLKIELFESGTPSGITFGSPIITSGFTNAPVSVSVASSAISNATYNITLTDAEIVSASLSGAFSINMTTSVPNNLLANISSNSYTVTLTPGEYIV